LLIRDPETVRVTTLEEHLVSQLDVDPFDVLGVDRQPVLIRLARRPDDPHGLACELLSEGEHYPLLPLACVSAEDPGTRQRRKRRLRGAPICCEQVPKTTRGATGARPERYPHAMV
jgi:hypothetical protein